MTDKKGFTLMELLVSMAIFGVISGLVVVNFRAGARGDELRLAAESVAAALRDAEARTAAGVQSSACAGGTRANLLCPNGAVDCDEGVCLTKSPSGGYGVAASPGADSVALFADHNGDGLFQDGEDLQNLRLSPTGNVIIETIVPDGLGSVITFLPPAGKALINGAEADLEFAVLLKHLATGSRRRVSANRVSRLVEVTTPP